MSTLQHLYDNLEKMVYGSEDQPPMSLEAAKKALMQQIIADNRPNSANLQQAQEAFCDFQKKNNRSMPKDFQPKLSGNEEEMQRRQAYSDRCLNVLMKHAGRMVEQHLQWDAAVKRLNLGTNLDGTEKTVDPKRWMSRLIKTDGSAASAAFNEKVVAMAALAEGVITEDEFRKCRKASYERDQSVPKDEIDKLVNDDCEKGVEGLLDILDGMVAEGRHKAPEIKNAAKQVLSGNLNDQQLEAAFDVIESDASYLMYNALNTMEDFEKNFVVKIPKEKLEDRSKEWEEDCTESLGYLSMAEQVANPYYAILEPQELYEKQIFSLKNPKGQAVRNDLLQLFSVANSTGIQNVVEHQLNQQLEKYGLSKDDNVVNLMTPDYTVYKKDTKEEFRAMIVAVVPPCKENNFEGGIREDVPGRIMKNFAAEINEKREKCAGVDTGASSGQFRDMKRKLNALRGKSLPESPDLDQVNDLMKQLAALEKATQVYLDKKNRQREDGKGKDPYEQNRMDFATDLQKFTKEKLTHLRYVQSHLSAQLSLEMDGVRTAKDVEPKENLGPQEDKFVGRPGTKPYVENPDPKKKKKAVERFVFEGEDDLAVDEYVKTFKTRYDKVGEQLTGANKADKWDAQTDVAAMLQSNQEMMLDQMGKKYMAGAVVKELLAMEEKLSGENGPVGPMQQLADGKKTGELVAMVWNSDSFIDKVRAQDFSDPAEMKRQEDANTPRQVAKEIMRNYLSHQRNANAQQKINQQNAPANGLENQNNGPKNRNPRGL